MEDFEINFADMPTTTRTPEESAARRALLKRQDVAAGIAYNGALSTGKSVQEARRAAAKARRETT